jgi:hypothetical protein
MIVTREATTHFRASSRFPCSRASSRFPDFRGSRRFPVFSPRELS